MVALSFGFPPWYKGAVVAVGGVRPPVGVDGPARVHRGVAVPPGLQDVVGEAGKVPSQAVGQGVEHGILFYGGQMSPVIGISIGIVISFHLSM